MKQGLVNSQMAMPDGYSDSEDRNQILEEADPNQNESQAHEDGETPAIEQQEDAQENEQESEQGYDGEYELALEKVMSAAVRAMKDPEVSQELSNIKGSQNQAEAVANLSMQVVDALDQASGAAIPEDVLPGATLGIAAMIGEVLDLDQATMAETAQTLVLNAMQQEGADPQQIREVMAQSNFTQMVQQASQQLGGSNVRK